MNQNDMDRYFWRTGRRWGGDNRSLDELRGRWKLLGRGTALLLVAFLITSVTLLLLR